MEISLPELFNMEMEQLEEERRKDPDDVIWRFSPLDIRVFDVMMNLAHNLVIGMRGDEPGPRATPISFVEAGSGIGTKLYLAKHKYFCMEYGYEINPDYVAMAKLLGVQCEVRDLAADPAPEWSAYDIVYTCRPFKSDVVEHQWEKSVQEAMRPGAVLIASFTSHKPYDWPCYLRAPFRGVWVKPEPGDGPTRSEARAEVVRRAAELAGMAT